MKQFKLGKVETYIRSAIEERKGLLFALVDPLDYPEPKKAINAGVLAGEAGADLILVGGSMGAQGELLDLVTKEIKSRVSVPIVLFPGNISTLSRHADAVYYMRLLNSRNTYWTAQAQTLAAPTLKQMNIEPLPVGYVVVEPGGTVGWVGDVNLVPRGKPQIAAAMALGAQYSGSRIIVTDAGSNPKEGPIPLEMVQFVSRAIEAPYVVAGGIRTPKQAKAIIAAGADAIQVGTAFEKSANPKRTAEELVKAVREGGKKKG